MSRSASDATAVAHGTVAPPCGGVAVETEASRGTTTVARSVGMARRIAASSARRSMRLPSYTDPSLATSTVGST